MQLDSSIFAQHMKISKSELLPKANTIDQDDNGDSSEEVFLDYIFQLDTTYRIVSFNRQQVLVQRIADNHYYLLRPQSSQLSSDMQPPVQNLN